MHTKVFMQIIAYPTFICNSLTLSQANKCETSQNSQPNFQKRTFRMSKLLWWWLFSYSFLCFLFDWPLETEQQPFDKFTVTTNTTTIRTLQSVTVAQQ